jgi:hypothetical protein
LRCLERLAPVVTILPHVILASPVVFLPGRHVVAKLLNQVAKWGNSIDLLLILFARSSRRGQESGGKMRRKSSGSICQPAVASRCPAMRLALMARKTVDLLTPAAAALIGLYTAVAPRCEEYGSDVARGMVTDSLIRFDPEKGITSGPVVSGS